MKGKQKGDPPYNLYCSQKLIIILCCNTLKSSVRSRPPRVASSSAAELDFHLRNELMTILKKNAPLVSRAIICPLTHPL